MSATLFVWFFTFGGNVNSQYNIFYIVQLFCYCKMLEMRYKYLFTDSPKTSLVSKVLSVILMCVEYWLRVKKKKRRKMREKKMFILLGLNH